MAILINPSQSEVEEFIGDYVSGAYNQREFVAGVLTLSESREEMFIIHGERFQYRFFSCDVQTITTIRDTTPIFSFSDKTGKEGKLPREIIGLMIENNPKKDPAHA